MYELGDLRSEKYTDTETNADWDKITTACNKARFKIPNNGETNYMLIATFVAAAIGGIFMAYSRYRR